MKQKLLLAVVFGMAFLGCQTGFISQAHALRFRAFGEWSGVVSNSEYDLHWIDNDDDGGSARFRWGEAAAGSIDNHFDFDGIGSDIRNGGAFETEPEPRPDSWLEVPFLLGDFSYQNGMTYHSIGIEGIDLTIGLDGFGSVRSFHEFHFSIRNTPNRTGDPVEDGDIVTIDSPLSETAFLWNNGFYTLKLLGFSQGTGETSTFEFLSPEDSLVSAGLYAKIIRDDRQPIPQPEPGTFFLLLLGLGGAWVLRSLKKRRFFRVGS
ncbi:MAG: choice-of-anchor K domain-containing protein [Thermodesulfobacteriota bacterium]